jgi:hypothetical protein
MIDVGVGDEGVGDLQQLGRTKGPDLAHIEEQSPVLPQNLHKERRVFERRIDHFGMKQRFQSALSFS